MHIPVAPQMTLETLAVGKRQRLPDALTLMTHRIQHHLPEAPVPRHRLISCNLPQLAGAACRGDTRRPLRRRVMTFPRDNRPWRERR